MGIVRGYRQEIGQGSRNERIGQAVVELRDWIERWADLVERLDARVGDRSVTAYDPDRVRGPEPEPAPPADELSPEPATVPEDSKESPKESQKKSKIY